jgi:hypothetical protein
VRDLVQRAKFDVVALDQVDVVHPEPGETLVHAAGHASGGEVERVIAVSADLGGQHVPVAVNTTQRFAEHGLGVVEPVVGGDVEEGDARVQGCVHRVDALLLGERSVDPAERRCAESELGYRGAVGA